MSKVWMQRAFVSVIADTKEEADAQLRGIDGSQVGEIFVELDGYADAELSDDQSAAEDDS